MQQSSRPFANVAVYQRVNRLGQGLLTIANDNTFSTAAGAMTMRDTMQH